MELPSGKKTVGNKWIFKVKYGDGGNVERFKAQLFEKGMHRMIMLVSL